MALFKITSFKIDSNYSRIGAALVAAFLLGLWSCRLSSSVQPYDPFVFIHQVYGRGGACSKEPLVLVYNRIPKAGSTTLMALAKELADRNGFRMVTPEPYYDHSKIRRAIFDAIASDTKTLVVNHFHFPEIVYGDQIAYMNIMRDPVNRSVSDYYYLRYSSRRGNHAAKYRETHGDLSLDECLFEKNNEFTGICEPDVNVQSSFFCGREGHPCHAQVSMLESLGLKNMRDHFSVGVEERYRETLDMLESTFPSFFKGLSAMYKDIESLNSNSHPEPSSRAQKHLTRLNKVDYTLYRQANRLLDEYIQTCL